METQNNEKPANNASTQRVGILLAPGSMNDYSLNQYVVEKLARQSTLEYKVHVAHPQPSIPDITSKVRRLIRKEKCTKLFVLGEQCKSAILKLLRDGALGGSFQIYMTNDPALTDETDHTVLLEEFRPPDGCRQQLLSHNYFESQLSLELTNVLRRLGDQYKTVFGEDGRIAVVGGPNVPITRRWLSGLQSGLAQSNLETSYHTLGTSYSKFNDPWSGYELTRYLIETYRPNFVVQICGASSIGVVEAIQERSTTRNKIYYVPFDYFDPSNPLFETNSVPICLVRRIGHMIDRTVLESPLPQRTGRVYFFKTKLGTINNQKFDSAHATMHRLELVDAPT